MNWTNFIRTLGFDEPTSLLSPAAYSEEEIEEDLLDLEMDKRHARNMVERKGDQYDAKLDEAAQAPEWMVEDLLREADDIEREKEDWQDEWRQHADRRRLVKSVKSFRRRIRSGERDLNVSELIADTDDSEVRRTLHDALKDHMRSTKQVNDLLQLFTDGRDLDRSRADGNARDLSKHEERMRERQSGASTGAAESRERDERRSPSRAGADD
ncbi:hypothetical protein [Halosimplex halophilum]|uniref:hypothetical protein n=1 Tax=Halosimplex halophilum TaxID=2559572 RepID=UPI00107F48E4|nr:hypothetical protein [Halosimplex halophilum]